MKILCFGSVALIALAAAIPAVAADVPVRAPVYKAPAQVMTPWNWTGFYAGGHLGTGWGSKEWFNGDAGDENGFDLEGAGKVRGFFGGFQAGYNYQINWVVVGIEGDFSWSGVKGTFLCFDVSSCTANARWFSTLTGRIGGTVDRALLYVKGGGAWVNDRFSFVDSFTPIALGSKTKSGWTAGAGIEYAFTPNWSGKIEYDYMDFGTSRVSFTGGDAGDPPDDALIRQRIHAVKVGLNYKFDWGAPLGKGPMVTRY
jgi:outer membrane immunogenic protein